MWMTPTKGFPIKSTQVGVVFGSHGNSAPFKQTEKIRRKIGQQAPNILPQRATHKLIQTGDVKETAAKTTQLPKLFT